jgi:hypothetical protein
LDYEFTENEIELVKPSFYKLPSIVPEPLRDINSDSDEDLRDSEESSRKRPRLNNERLNISDLQEDQIVSQVSQTEE